MAGQNVAQAKGRLKRLSRQLQAIEQIGLDAMRGKAWSQIAREVETTTSVMSVAEAHKHIQSLRNPLQQPERLNLNIRARQRSGDLVLRTFDLTIGYPGKPLFTAPDIILRRQECAALIGPNGTGKTTFLKTILGQHPPLEGRLDLGASIDIGYFAQAHEGLDPERSLVEEIEAIAPGMQIAEIRHYLARYLFTGDDVFKKVAVLSGGERTRLALAKLALSNANFLLLDEPSNHLDIPSQEILQAVLADFQGTIILVSHDRYLIDALASQVWEIDQDESNLDVYPRPYSEYRLYKEARGGADALEEDSQTPQREAYRDERAAKNRAQAQERRRKKRIAEIEARITTLEARLAALGEQLEDPPDDLDEVQRLGDDYVEIQNELHALIAEWEQLQT
jgi:ATP-binding cassette subfamily F protein 3